MRKFPGLIIVCIFLAALNWRAGAQTTNVPVDAFAQAVLANKARLENCLAGLSGKDSAREARGTAALSASFFLESYDQFVRGLDNNQRLSLISDAELMNRLCLLHIAYAEYQLEEARIDANPPSVAALERAFKEYQQACACLKAVSDRNIIAKNGAGIAEGLTRTIAGLNRYADWFEKDVFMNPDGRKWEANPAPQAEKLRVATAGGASSSGEIAICENAINQVLRDVQKAMEAKDGARALDNMILGVRWLTTLLRKSPAVFVNNFQRFNVITRPAMEEIRKGYAPDKMKEFAGFYEPLKSHYIALSVEKK